MSSIPSAAPGTNALPMRYLDKALNALSQLHLPQPADRSAPVVALVSRLAGTDEGRVVAIARVLQHMSHFSAIVREQIVSAAVSDRFNQIVSDFDSIRRDGQRMIAQLDDGRIDLREKAANAWMRITRGDISTRFDRIRKTFLDVTEDTATALERERAVMTMYADFRMAMKEAEILARELLAQQEARLIQAREALKGAQAKVDDPASAEGADLAHLALARDECVRQLQDEDAKYQIAKDLAENLQVGYATSEAVMLRLNQTHAVKDRVNQRAITFFSTNEVVFTAINAAFVSQLGLNESTKTLDAMVDGTNRGLEAVADLGDVVLKEGLRAGYGSTVGIDSVRRLVDAVVRFQEGSQADIAAYREQATRDANEIAQYVEQGKQRFAALVRAAGADTTGVPQPSA